MEVSARGPFLVVGGDGGLGHSQRLHAVCAGVVGDVVVELVSGYHPRGDGEAPFCEQGSEKIRKTITEIIIVALRSCCPPTEPSNPPSEKIREWNLEGKHCK